jgi:hypothetical protein
VNDATNVCGTLAIALPAPTLLDVVVGVVVVTFY